MSRVSLDCYSKDVIAWNSFSASSNIRFRRCHWRSFALWSPGSLERLQRTHLPIHSALCLAHRANRHGHFHLHHYPHEFWALRTDWTHLPIKGLLLHDGWQLQVLLVDHSSGSLRLLRPQILWVVRWGNPRGSGHWRQLSFHFAPTQGEHDGYERLVKQFSNCTVFREFQCLSFFRAFWCGSWRFHAEIFRRATQSYRTTAGRSVSKGMPGGEFHRITPPGLETQRYPGITTFFHHRGIFLHVILYLCST